LESIKPGRGVRLDVVKISELENVSTVGSDMLENCSGTVGKCNL